MAKKTTTPLRLDRPVIYCGPSLPRRNLVTMSTFKKGLPPHVEALIEKNPDIGKLIVPVGELAAMRVKTEKQGTEENRLYQAVKNSKERSGEDGTV